jgi:hypothetical protein
MTPLLKAHGEGRHGQATKKVAVAPYERGTRRIVWTTGNGVAVSRRTLPDKGTDSDWLPNFVADLTNQSGDQRRMQYGLSYEYALERFRCP